MRNKVEYLNTKTELLHILRAWNVTEPVPTKGKKLVVCFPPGADFRYGEVIWDGRKSTYGKTLYKTTLHRDFPAMEGAN